MNVESARGPKGGQALLSSGGRGGSRGDVEEGRGDVLGAMVLVGR